MKLPLPFPLPPILARLFEALEGWTENREAGFFMAEQDRNDQARAQPVLVYVAPERLRESEVRPGAQAPSWIGEVVVEASDPERIGRYARAGVEEYWRASGSPLQIEVLTGPKPDGTFAERRVFASEDVVETAMFPGLELKPFDLEPGT